jgi:histidinol dehydrogenase
MQLSRFPAPADWAALCQRPAADLQQLRPAVQAIFNEVRLRGDAALIEYTARFDAFAAPEVVVWDEAAITAAAEAAAALRPALEVAVRNIRTFHTATSPSDNVATEVATQPGVRCWSRRVPLGRVGLYIPGGSAPLFSTLLMLAIPAQLAGCTELVVCTPPGPDGALAPVIAAAAQVLGLKRIVGVGGAQAIAALAIGTATIPRVDKICGPGNAWVTAAKQLAAEVGTAIDLPAGPSEVLILADYTANPAWLAADLLAQAEHGADSQVIVVSDDESVLTQTMVALQAQLAALPRREIAAAAVSKSRAVLVSSLREGLAFAEAYAPEHLILAVQDPAPLAGQVRRAGSVFLGHFAPESCGDYASGPNHTLPTAGAARAYSGVSVETFTRRITFQELTPVGLRDLGPTVIALAEAEGLQAHAAAVRIRLPAAQLAADEAAVLAGKEAVNA